jgi:hypothetical protein
LRSRAISLALLAALSGGCLPPGEIAPGADLTVSALLSGRTGAALTELPSGREVEVPLGPNREAFVVLNSQQLAAEKMMLAVAQGNALQAPGFSVVSLPAELPGAKGNFEQRLHAAEAGLRAAPPKPQYHLLAPPQYSVGSRDTFCVIADLQDGRSTEIQVPAKAAYVGKHCYVFVDEQIQDSGLTDKVTSIGRAFDEKIFPTDVRLFGEALATGVNGDPKVTLLISPVVGNYGRDTTIGYFTLRDLFAPGADPTNPMLKHSNQRLMLYVSPYVINRGQPADYLGTIAHECEHLINASQKLFRRGSAGSAMTEDLWLDEALAMYAMEANGFGLAASGSVVFNHVASYLANPAAYSLVDWQNNPQESGYGPGYLFATYLADRFGENMLKELVGSPQIGIANLNGRLAPRTTTFRQVFDDWTAANLLDGTNLTTDPRYNYRTLDLLGTYELRRLRGMRLDPVKVPTTGSLPFRPYSAQYLYLPQASSKTLRFTLRGSQTQNFGGMVVSP